MLYGAISSSLIYIEFSFDRFTGTIVGVGDISPQWSDSKWRSLKVNIASNLLS